MPKRIIGDSPSCNWRREARPIGKTWHTLSAIISTLSFHTRCSAPPTTSILPSFLWPQPSCQLPTNIYASRSDDTHDFWIFISHTSTPLRALPSHSTVPCTAFNLSEKSLHVKLKLVVRTYITAHYIWKEILPFASIKYVNLQQEYLNSFGLFDCDIAVKVVL